MEAQVPTGCPFAGPDMSRVLRLEPDALLHQGDVMASLSAADPVVWVPEVEAYAVTSHDCVIEVLTDTDRFSSQLGDPKGPKMMQRLLAARQELVERSDDFRKVAERLNPDWRQVKLLTTADPPRHTRHRRLVNRLFTPRRVAALEGRIQAITDELIAGFVERGRADLVAEFAVGLPLQIIAEQLGVGGGSLDDFKRWSDDLVFATGNDRPTSDDIMRITGSLVEIDEFVREVLADRRLHPQDDFVTTLAQAESEDPDDPLLEEERIGMIAVMLSAGNETTTKLLASGAAILGRSPDVAATLHADPSKVPAFVEEALRLEPPLQGIFRIVRHDTQLGGVHLPAGSAVWVLYGAANRTEAAFPGQATVDLDRPNLREHVAFGHGIHYCVGAPLARLEGVVAFRSLLAQIHPWQIELEEMESSYMLHGPRRLDVTFEPRHAQSLAAT